MAVHAHPRAVPSDAEHGESRPPPPLLVGWTRVGAACGFLVAVSYALGLAVPGTALELAAVCLLGPAFMGFSMGLYQVLRAHRRTISLDLGLVANLAGGLTVTLMLFAQLGLNRWFELQFGAGSTDSSERALHAAFEAGNGIQLGLDVAWDLFFVLGAVLLAWNMWQHPRFGRLLAISGGMIAIALLVINLAVFPEPPGHDAIDLGPVMGLWYVIVTIRLAMSGHWAAANEVAGA